MNYSKIFFILMLCCLLCVPMSVSANEKYSAAGSHAKSLLFLESKGIPDLERFGRSVTRAEFAMYMVRALQLPTMVSGRKYSDVGASHIYYEDIQTATAAGIIQGDTTTGKFNPSAPISRIHMVRMITNALELVNIVPTSAKNPNFSDTKGVSADYAKRIMTTYNLGIITGDMATGQFNPFKNATVAQSATFITRFYDVIDRQKKWYSVADIVSGNLQLKGYYTSFNSAKNALKEGQIILYKDKVRYMNDGIVYFTKYNTMFIESTYSDNDAMSLLSSTEAMYVSSTEKGVAVQIGDLQQTYTHEEVSLIPTELTSVPRSYYIVDSGELVHYEYKHVLKRYEPAYIVGAAPTKLTVGQRYYSVDGITFYNQKAQVVGNFYNYYQYMPFRVATKYTANQLNEMISTLLVEAEKKGYKHATTQSKLIGLGQALKDAEQTYHMNAMALLAMATYESNYGMSEQAQKHNNLIGTAAVLSQYGKANYRSPSLNIQQMAQYFSDEYVTPYRSQIDKKRKSGHGAVLGSKAVGMNKKYTANPFWGAQVASIYYRLDKQFGNKDAQQQVKVAFTAAPKASSLPTYETADTRGKIAFEYRNFGLPVAVVQIGESFTKIIADDDRFTHVYMPSSSLKMIQTIQ